MKKKIAVVIILCVYFVLVTSGVSKDKGYIIGIHGINQAWETSWLDLDVLFRSMGYNVVGIDLPDRGHKGWQRNSEIIGNAIGNCHGPINGLFGYSLGGVSWVRYLEENLEPIKDNPGGTLVLLEPAFRSSFGKSISSPALRPVIAPFSKQFFLTEGQQELTGRDASGFLESAKNQLPKLAQELAQHKWRVVFIDLGSGIVDADAIKEAAEVMNSAGVVTEVINASEICKKSGLPELTTIGNQGYLSKNGQGWQAITSNFTKTSHAGWNPTMRQAILSSIASEFSPSEPPSPAKSDGAQDLGGIDLSSIQLNYMAEFSEGETHGLGYVLKGKRLGQGEHKIDIEKSSQLSLQSFLVWLSLPNYTFWVNLNPSEPDRIVDHELGKTDMGEIMLEADLQLKKDLGKMTHPQESKSGRVFWDKLYEYVSQLQPVAEQIGIPVAFRVWIIPGEIKVYANQNEIYVVDAKLKACLESDYLALLSKPQVKITDPLQARIQSEAEKLLKKLILPGLNEAINEAPQYLELRQIYHSLIIAEWYKNQFINRSGIFSGILNSRNVRDLESKELWNAQEIFDEYVVSLKEGEYSLTETFTQSSGGSVTTIVKEYFTGGVDFTHIQMTVVEEKIDVNLTPFLFEALWSPFGSCSNKECLFGALYRL